MDLIKIVWDNNSLFISINCLLFIIFFLVGLVLIWIFRPEFIKRDIGIFEIDEATIGIGKHRIKIKPNYIDLQIAYKLWVELSTRKLGLPIDFDNDVIVEIYNSWYDFFRITREMIKEIPIAKIREHQSTREIVRISVEVLNEAIRPHLTKWHAKFRKWFNSEINKEENIDMSPQDIQKKYPEYVKMVDDMKTLNKNLIEYRNILMNLAIKKNKI